MTSVAPAESATACVWVDDALLPGFSCTTIELPAEDDGELCATLVRCQTHDVGDTTRSTRAVLYLHGFVDYFFQEHVAAAFLARGWDFYALDLRRYGRSLRGNNRPNYCTDLAHYDAEIDRAIDIVRREDGHDTLVLMGHSTGGLTSSWYTHRLNDRGVRRGDVQALVLNSPFFDFAVPFPQSVMLPIGSVLGAVWPSGADTKGIPPWYGQSLLEEYHGEWSYQQKWKPLHGFPVYFGWVRTIRKIQLRCAAGLSIACPVLLLHSASSIVARGGWNDAYLANDIVLDVEDMKARAPRLGTDVTLRAFPDGLHDLMLSRASVRDAVIGETLDWLQERVVAPTTGASRA